jgi:glycosyltransferase involved in cell wall biosynthesis
VSLTVLSVSYPLARAAPNTAGGAEQALLTIDKSLVRNGYRSIVIAPSGSRCSGLLVPVPIPSGTLDRDAQMEAQSAFADTIRQTIEHFPVDVMHMHGLDFHNYLPDLDIPVVVSLHLPLDWYEPAALRPRRNVALVCVSDSQARTAPFGVHIDRVVSNGVDVEDFEPARRKGNYFLVLGRICPEKAIHLAIASAKHTGEKLVIAGEVYDYAEHRSYFDGQIRPLLNHSAIFIGAVGGSRKRQLLAGAKAVLIPSHAPETSSLVAIEALATGTPVIGWRSGALPEIVEDGYTGFIVSSVAEMSHAMTRIGAIQPDTCRREARSRFSSGFMFEKFLGLYRQLVPGAEFPELMAA